MSKIWELFGFLRGLSLVFFFVCLGLQKYMPVSSSENVALWLLGVNKREWPQIWCSGFDRLFGGRLLSFRAFAISAVLSITGVAVIYFLFAKTFGFFDARTIDTFGFWKVLIIGSAINIIADYLSLLETRWLLGQFGRFPSFIGHAGLFIFDALFTGLIILIFIYVANFIAGAIAGAQTKISLVEILAAFSIYSVFFYSTFLTSISAWLYCITAILIRVASSRPVGLLHNIERYPLIFIGFAGALVLASLQSGINQLSARTDQNISVMDDWLCKKFPAEACSHARRMTLANACENGNISACNNLGNAFYDMGASPQAAEKYRHTCEESSFPYGCYNQGLLLAKGIGGPVDLAKSLKLFKKACNLGLLRGCVQIGVAYAQGVGVKADMEIASRYFMEACSKDDAEACANVGVLYENGQTVQADAVRAFDLYDKSCAAGSDLGCINLGNMYLRGKVVQPNEKKAIRLFMAACSNRYQRACMFLGEMEQKAGRPAAALKIYEDGCRNSHAESCNRAGTLHLPENEFLVDPAKSAEYFAKACALGNNGGCSQLAAMYLLGSNGQRNVLRAVELLTAACESKDLNACANLGILHLSGEGVPEDHNEAFRLVKMACDGGSLLGCRALGQMYERGIGAPKDPNMAFQLLLRTCQKGYRPACSALKGGD